MIKNSFLFLILFFGVTALMGQSREFPTGEAEWTYNLKNKLNQATLSTFSYRLTGDTIINGITYQSVGDGYDGFFKTEGKKVYYLPPDSTQAYLYYDFDLVVGDTFLNVQPSHYQNNYDTIYVTQIDSVLTNDGYRKRWHFTAPGEWIEGVGHAVNLIHPVYGFPNGLLAYLFCFEKENSLIIENTVEVFSDDGYNTYLGLLTCDGFTSPTNDLSLQNKKVKLSPNPFLHQFEILSPIIPEGTTIEIFSIHGQLLKSVSYQGTITISDFSAGTYLLSFMVEEFIYTALLQKL